MNKEKTLILAVIEELAQGKASQKISDIIGSATIDWLQFKEMVIYHDLAPFVYSMLKDSLSFVPPKLVEFFKNTHYCTVTRCEQIWQQFLHIVDAFEKANIVLVPLKGVAFLEDLYKHRFVRPMTDIDLLVKEKDLEKAEEVFSNLGYKKELHGLREEYWRKNQYHITFYKKDRGEAPFVELHWALDYKRGGRAALPELWQRTRTINVEGRIIELLSFEDTLFCLALHNRRCGKTLCLKNVCDAVLLLDKYGPQFDWEYVLRMATTHDLCATLFFFFSQINVISKVNIPHHVVNGLKVSRWKRHLIARFINTFTFFSQDTNQPMTRYLESHFLLYDSIWEPIRYIIDIPQEQFAKFYGLEAYERKTMRLYRNRLFYIPYKTITNKALHGRGKTR